MKKWSHVLSAAILTVGICLGYGQEAQAMVGGKPVIGISWKSPKQAKSYEAFKKIITMAGGIPVELDQIKSTDRWNGGQGLCGTFWDAETGVC